MIRIIPLGNEAAPQLSPDLIWNGLFGDLAIAPAGGLRSEQQLATAVLICLMTDRRVDPSELRDGDTNKGWPGDPAFIRDTGVPIGSRLWLLRRRSVSEIETPRLAEDYAREALQTLIDQEACVRVDATATAVPARNRLDLDIALYGRDGGAVYQQKFGVLWEQLYGVSKPLSL
jgi:phage gp46-like protein